MSDGLRSDGPAPAPLSAARHTKAGKSGVKAESPNLRRSGGQTLQAMEDVVEELFVQLRDSQQLLNAAAEISWGGGALEAAWSDRPAVKENRQLVGNSVVVGSAAAFVQNSRDVPLVV
jgi:hypothetical protein